MLDIFHFEPLFCAVVQPYLRRMMTRKWLTDDEDFDQLYRRTKLLSENCALMRPPHVQVRRNETSHFIEFIPAQSFNLQERLPPVNHDWLLAIVSSQ